MSQDSNTGISFKEATIIFELGYHNRELSFLLFWGKEKKENILLPIDQHKKRKALLPGDELRTKVDKVLNKPEDYLNSLRLTLSTISCITEDVVDLAKKYHIQMNLLYAKDVSDKDIHYYIFHCFSAEAINTINSLFLEEKDPLTFTDLDLRVKYAYSCLTQMKADLLVTINRFQEYVNDFPTEQSRSTLISKQYIDTTYD